MGGLPSPRVPVQIRFGLQVGYLNPMRSHNTGTRFWLWVETAGGGGDEMHRDERSIRLHGQETQTYNPYLGLNSTIRLIYGRKGSGN